MVSKMTKAQLEKELKNALERIAALENHAPIVNENLKFRALIEKSKDIFTLIGADGKILYKSPSVLEVMGYTPEELAGKNIFEILHPEDETANMKVFEKIMAEPGGTFNSQTRYKHKNGEWRRVDITATNLLNEEGVGAIAVSYRDVTKQYQMQAQLQNDGFRYRTLFEDAPTPLLEEDFSGVQKKLFQLRENGIIDLRGYLYSHPEFVIECISLVQILDVNKAAVKLFGASQKKDLLKKLDKIISHEDTIGIADQLLALESGQTTYFWEGVNYTLEGKEIRVQIHLLVPPGHEESLSRVMVAMTDVTARQKTEAALKKSEMQYRLLADNMSDMVWLMDLDLQAFYISPSTEKIQGYTLEDLRSMTLEEQLTPESYERAMAFYTEELPTASPSVGYDIDLEFYRRDGSTYWSRNTFKVIWDENDQPVMILGVGRDVTNKKIAGEELRKSEERYRSIAEDMPAMICRFTADGTLTFVNSFYCNYFNAAQEELLGSNFFKLIPETEWENVQKKHPSLNYKNPFVTYEYKGLDADGKEYWQRWSHRALFNEEGEVVEYQSIGEDITDRKKADTAISRQLSELETLYESGLTISRLLSPKAIAQKVIEILDRRMNWHHIAIRQYRVDTNSVELLAFNRPNISTDEANEFIARMNSLISNPNQGLSGWVTLNGKSIRVPNVKNDERYIDVFSEIYSGLYVPLKIGDRVLGSISVESTEENAFSEQDERLLETLAVQAAIAVENANLFLTTEKRSWSGSRQRRCLK